MVNTRESQAFENQGVHLVTRGGPLNFTLTHHWGLEDFGMRLPAGSARGTVDYFDNIAFHFFSKKITNTIGVIAF